MGNIIHRSLACSWDYLLFWHVLFGGGRLSEGFSAGVAFCLPGGCVAARSHHSLLSTAPHLHFSCSSHLVTWGWLSPCLSPTRILGHLSDGSVIHTFLGWETGAAQIRTDGFLCGFKKFQPKSFSPCKYISEAVKIKTSQIRECT